MQGIKIKPLAWSDDPSSALDCAWIDNFGLYQITDEAVLFVGHDSTGTQYPTIAAAKAAAQADYEDRIIAALDVQPLTVQDAAPVAEIAAERDAYKLRGDNHWETIRCIYRIATVEGDMDAIIQHIKDAGQGSSERPEETLRHYQTEVARLTSELAALRAIAEGRA